MGRSIPIRPILGTILEPEAVGRVYEHMHAYEPGAVNVSVLPVPKVIDLGDPARLVKARASLESQGKLASL
ncbi:MAG: hypothetical protein ACREQ4_06270 [Candidatus Binataceae bacterium]